MTSWGAGFGPRSFFLATGAAFGFGGVFSIRPKTLSILVLSGDFFMPNLASARAKINFAQTETPILERDIRAYFESHPYSIVKDTHHDFPGGQFHILKVTREIPDSVRVRIGVILNCYRDSLDHLTVALAEKNGAVEPKDVYFPISSTMEGFFDKRSQGKIRRLSDADKAAIIALKPYRGGNEGLFTLNALTNKDGHRKILSAFHVAIPAQFGGFGYFRRVATYIPGTGPYPDCASVFIDADPGTNLKVSVTISFAEAGAAHGKPVIEVLNEFGSLCSAIVDLFDPAKAP